MPIYFIQDETSGLIKIGYSGDPEKRLRYLRSQKRPNKLYLLGTTRGYIIHERQLHLKFWRLHVEGEWFKPGRKLLDYIAEKAIKPLPPIYEPYK